MYPRIVSAATMRFQRPFWAYSWFHSWAIWPWRSRIVWLTVALPVSFSVLFAKARTGKACATGGRFFLDRSRGEPKRSTRAAPAIIRMRARLRIRLRRCGVMLVSIHCTVLGDPNPDAIVADLVPPGAPRPKPSIQVRVPLREATLQALAHGLEVAGVIEEVEEKLQDVALLDALRPTEGRETVPDLTGKLDEERRGVVVHADLRNSRADST